MNNSALRILEVRIDMVDYDSTLSQIKDNIKHHSFGNYICACNVHVIMVSRNDKELKNALDNSLLTVPDGLPVVWAARNLGASIKATVRGTNLMLRSCEMAERLGYSVFLYGGKPQTLKELREALLKHYPCLRITGVYSPPFRSLTLDEEKKIVEMINLSSPDILFVGLGAPKQEKWMADHCHRIKVPITIGVGAAFDFLSGEKKQAPAWMQARGLEWLFRLKTEPTRLWGRYMVYNPLFTFLFLGQLIKARLLGKQERNFRFLK